MDRTTTAPRSPDTAAVKIDGPENNAADWLAAPALMFFIGSLLIVSAILGG